MAIGILHLMYIQDNRLQNHFSHELLYDPMVLTVRLIVAIRYINQIEKQSKKENTAFIAINGYRMGHASPMLRNDK